MTGKSIPAALVCMLVFDVTFGFLPLYAVSREDESREDAGSSGSTSVAGSSVGLLPSKGSQGGGSGSAVGLLPGGGATGGGSDSAVELLPSGGATGGGSDSLGPCDDVCTKILEPVCGSDGRDYNNFCILKNASCRSQLNGGPPITAAFTGFCNRNVRG